MKTYRYKIFGVYTGKPNQGGIISAKNKVKAVERISNSGLPLGYGFEIKEIKKRCQ